MALSRLEEKIRGTLYSLCPGCGRAAAEEPLCVHCAHPLEGREARWNIAPPHTSRTVANSVMSLMMIGLGLLIGLGSWLGGESHPAHLVGYLLLGLLVVTGGGVSAWLSTPALLEAIRGLRQVSYRHKQRADSAGSSDTEVFGTVRRGPIVDLGGDTVQSEPLDGYAAGDRPEAVAAPGRALATLLVRWWRSGQVELRVERHTSWSLREVEHKNAEDPREITIRLTRPTSELSMSASLSACLAGLLEDPLEEPPWQVEDADDFYPSFEPLPELASRVLASRDARRTLEAALEGLPDPSEDDAHIVSVVAAALRIPAISGEAGTPAHDAG